MIREILNEASDYFEVYKIDKKTNKEYFVKKVGNWDSAAYLADECNMEKRDAKIYKYKFRRVEATKS